MARTISTTIATEVGKSVTRPGYLIRIPGVDSIPNLNSRGTLSNYGTLTTPNLYCIGLTNAPFVGVNDFNISGIAWDYSGAQRGKLDFNDDLNNSWANYILSPTTGGTTALGSLAGQSVEIYLYYQGAVTITTGTSFLALADAVPLFIGIVDSTEITAEGRVIFNLVTEQLETLNSPRRYIKPGPVATGFNWVPPAGTILTWGNQTIRLERS